MFVPYALSILLDYNETGKLCARRRFVYKIRTGEITMRTGSRVDQKVIDT